MQLALSLLAEMAESTGQRNTIAAALAMALAGRAQIGSWHWAWWPMAESSGKRNTITASLAIALAGKVTICSWR